MLRAVLLTYSVLFYFPVFGQYVLSGTVIDELGYPLPFASVSCGESYGAVCNEVGHFYLTLNDSLTTYLVVSTLGYHSDTFAIADNRTSYQLTAKKYELDEIKVQSHSMVEDKSVVAAFTTHQKEILNLTPRNVSEILQTKAGFTNRSGYQTPLTLRGMSGKRLLVLRNGIRRFSSYPAGYMSHTTNVYDLERIEVEKGAPSVAYGAGAMAGVINLVDKSPFKQAGFNAKISMNYASVNKEKSGLICGGWSNGDLALKVGFRSRDAENFTYPDGSIAENSFYQDKDAFISAGYRFSPERLLVVNGDFHFGGPWGKALGFNGTDYMRVQTVDENSKNYVLKYRDSSVGIFSNFVANLFFSNESRAMYKRYYTAAEYGLSYEETTRFSDHYYGVHTKAEIQVFDPYYIKTGAEAYRFNISSPMDVVDYIEELSFSNRVSQNAHKEDVGFYLENHIQLASQLKAVAGIRYSLAMIHQGDVFSNEQTTGLEQQKDALSGNISLLSRWKNHSRLKLNVARSFRMPETSEMFSDSYTSNGIIYGNSRLKPEYCKSFDVSYRYSSSTIQLEASPFLWIMNDMINKEEIKGMPGTNYSYVNIGKARLFGGEINGRFNYRQVLNETDNLSLQYGVAYLNGTDVSQSTDVWSEGIPLNYVPPFNMKVNVSYRWRQAKNTECYLAFRSIYYTSQKRLGDSPYATPAYLFLACNLGFSLSGLKSKPAINVSINNLLNTAYYNYQSYLLSAGRDVRILLSFNI